MPRGHSGELLERMTALAAAAKRAAVAERTEKVCGKCRTVLPLDQFGSNRSQSDGLDGYCRVCRRAQLRDRDARRKAAAMDAAAQETRTASERQRRRELLEEAERRRMRAVEAARYVLDEERWEAFLVRCAAISGLVISRFPEPDPAVELRTAAVAVRWRLGCDESTAYRIAVLIEPGKLGNGYVEDRVQRAAMMSANQLAALARKAKSARAR